MPHGFGSRFCAASGACHWWQSGCEWTEPNGARYVANVGSPFSSVAMVASRRSKRCGPREASLRPAWPQGRGAFFPVGNGSGIGRGYGRHQSRRCIVAGGTGCCETAFIARAFPAAADNHQFHNARAFEETGAALLLEQHDATPEKVSSALRELVEDAFERDQMKSALGRWHSPHAAEKVAENIVRTIRLSNADVDAANIAAHAGSKTRAPLVTSTLS